MNAQLSTRSLPQLSAADFAGLPADLRRELSTLKPHLPRLAEASLNRKLRSECAELAGRLRGVKVGPLYRRVKAYLKSGDPLDLVDKRRSAKLWETKDGSTRGLPVVFCQWAQGICEKHQRNSARGLDEILKIWRTHRDAEGKHYDAIPGYAEWPDAEPRTGRPRGWTDRNLRRACAPDQFDAAASRIGLAAAAQFRPAVITTRVGLRVGERVEFDDHEYNVKVLFPGQSRALRPLGFTAADCLSSALFPAFRPTLWDAEAGKRKMLTEREFMWFVIHHLATHGFRTDDRGTTLVVEHGTAAIREDFERRIADACGGHVRVARGGMFKDPAHQGQFEPRGRGNFHFKPLIESAFNIVDNHMDRTIGQVGKDRNHSPAELHGREKYLRALVDENGMLPVEAKLPFLTWSQFFNKANDAYKAINTDMEHRLEGWAELGFETIDWRLTAGDEWRPMQALLELPEDARLVANAMIETKPELRRPRKLSRTEVWQSGRKELTPVRPELFCELMGLHNGVELSCGAYEPGYFTHRSMDRTGGRTVRFFAVSRDGRQFRKGEKFLCFFNPFNPAVLQLCKPNGEHVALCDAYFAPGRNDEEAKAAVMGAQGKWLAERAEAREMRHLDDAMARQDMKDHNAALARPKILDDAEIEATDEVDVTREVLKATPASNPQPEDIEDWT